MWATCIPFTFLTNISWMCFPIKSWFWKGFKHKLHCLRNYIKIIYTSSIGLNTSKVKYFREGISRRWFHILEILKEKYVVVFMCRHSYYCLVCGHKQSNKMTFISHVVTHKHFITSCKINLPMMIPYVVTLYYFKITLSFCNAF